MVINLCGSKTKTKDDMKELLNNELGEDALTKKYDMNRISRQSLINMGMEDDRSEFERRCDQKEFKQYNEEMDGIILDILSKPIN